MGRASTKENKNRYQWQPMPGEGYCIKLAPNKEYFPLNAKYKKEVSHSKKRAKPLFHISKSYLS